MPHVSAHMTSAIVVGSPEPSRPSSLRLANSPHDFAARRIGALPSSGLFRQSLMDPPNMDGVVRRVGLRKVNVGGGHYVEGVAGARGGVGADANQRLVEQPEPVRRNPDDQRRLVVKMTVERTSRHANRCAHPSQGQSVHAVGRMISSAVTTRARSRSPW